MEVERLSEYIYSDTELDQAEGQVIEELKANSQQIIPDPDEWLDEELKENILSWWMRHAPDRELGGFHGHIDHRNQAVRGAGKGSVLNARILWTFSAAYRMYEEPAYLDNARRAYAYIISYFTDKKHGGVYWELEPDGSVRSSRKQIYAIAFTIYGMVEYHLATGEDQPLKYALGLFRDIEAHALDPLYNGYTEAMTREWEALDDLRLSEKDDNESKTMNTHLHILEAYGNLYRVWKDPELKNALENLIRLFLDKFVDRERMQLNLFFDDYWNLKSTLVSYGHDIECSWLLHEAALILGDEELVKEFPLLLRFDLKKMRNRVPEFVETVRLFLVRIVPRRAPLPDAIVNVGRIGGHRPTHAVTGYAKCLKTLTKPQTGKLISWCAVVFLIAC